MIKKLKIKNFKSIKNIELIFNKFNILCGNNASGKTAIIHSILSITQKYEDAPIELDGEIIKIGKYDEIHNRNTNKDIQIGIESDTGKNKRIEISRYKNPKKSGKLNIKFENDLFYLSSSRIGVLDTYVKGNTKFGTNGISFVDFILKNREVPMSDKYVKFFEQNNRTKIPNTLLQHIKYWLKDITNEDIELVQIAYTNQYRLTFRDNTRSINTGSGFSYLLPIIAVCLGSLIINDKPIIIIENPEIYLHPKAQEKLTKFLLFISKFAQIIIETHSDHILKTSIGHKNFNGKIFVLYLNENGETKKIAMTHKNFKTNPISYAEVQYKAFGIITQELHIILYGQLHKKCCSSNSIEAFDKYMLQNMPKVPKKHDNYNYNKKAIYETLPTYIRNCIDHPENTNRPKYSEKELKLSIEFLLEQL